MKVNYDSTFITSLFPNFIKCINNLNNSSISNVIKIKLSNEINYIDIEEYFNLCSKYINNLNNSNKNANIDLINNFSMTFTKQITLLSTFENIIILEELIKNKIASRLAKQNSIKLLKLVYDKIDKYNIYNNNNNYYEDSYNKDIISIWFNLFFMCIDITSNNLGYYFENNNYTQYLIKLDKKIFEELINRFINYITNNNYLFEDEANLILKKIKESFNIKEDNNDIEYSHRTVSKESLLSCILILILIRNNTYSLTEDKDLIDKNNIDNSRTSYNNFNCFLMSKFNADFLKYNSNSQQLSNIITIDDILRNLITEYMSINLNENINEIYEYSKPTFTYNIKRNFENIYEEIPLLVKNNRLIIYLIIFYKKIDDSLEISIKINENYNIEENILPSFIFKNLNYVFTLNINSLKDFEDYKLIDIIHSYNINNKSLLFKLNNFKKRYNEITCNSSTYNLITIKINMKINYIYSNFILVINKLLVNNYSNDIDCLKNINNIFLIPKDTFFCIIKQIHYELLAIYDKDYYYDYILLIIIKWLEDKNNLFNNLEELINLLIINNSKFTIKQIDLLINFVCKISIGIQDNNTLKYNLLDKVINIVLNHKDNNINNNICNNKDIIMFFLNTTISKFILINYY